MEKTACLILDVQQADTALLPDGGAELVKRLSRLIAWCRQQMVPLVYFCLLYTSDAADE